MFTRKAANAALALLAVLSMTLISGIAHADVTGTRVTGGGQYLFSDRLGAGTVAVHAIRHNDGTVTGQVEQHYPDIGVSLHGEVNCLFVVGNRAYVSGVITDVQQGLDNPYYSKGTYFILAIEDNGEGRNPLYGYRDRVSLVVPSSNPLDCADPVAQGYADEFMNELTRGNFQVVP